MNIKNHLSRNYSAYLIIFLSIIFVIVSIGLVLQQRENVCTDSDGSQNFLEKGSCTDQEGEYWDECESSVNISYPQEESIILDREVNEFSTIDIDDDGDTDILLTDRDVPQLFLYINNGYGEFSEEIIFGPEDRSIKDFQVVDFDNDGKEEILALSGYNIWGYKYEGDDMIEFLSLQISYPYPKALAAADIDNDGDTDIFYTLETSLRWLKNTGDSINFEEENIGQLGGHTQARNTIAFLNFDQDSDLDILTIVKKDGGGSNIKQWENKLPDEIFGHDDMIELDELATELHVVDLDNDNDLDILTKTENKVLWLERNGNDLTEHIIDDSCTSTYFSYNYPNYHSYYFDMDADNDIDIVSPCKYDSGSAGYIKVYRNNGQGEFVEDTIEWEGSTKKPLDITTANINQDSYNDIIFFDDYHNDIILLTARESDPIITATDWRCEDSVCVKDSTECALSCEDGACKECIDNDASEQRPETVASYVETLDERRDDQCTVFGNLYEYICTENNQITYDYVNSIPGYICYEGALIKSSSCDESADGITIGTESGDLSVENTCADETLLLKYYCYEDLAMFTRIDCICRDNGCDETISCEDEDQYDFYNLGYAREKLSSGEVYDEGADYCDTEDNRILYEAICADGNIGFVDIICPGGCENGACAGDDAEPTYELDFSYYNKQFNNGFFKIHNYQWDDSANMYVGAYMDDDEILGPALLYAIGKYLEDQELDGQELIDKADGITLNVVNILADLWQEYLETGELSVWLVSNLLRAGGGVMYAYDYHKNNPDSPLWFLLLLEATIRFPLGTLNIDTLESENPFLEEFGDYILYNELSSKGGLADMDLQFFEMSENDTYKSYGLGVLDKMKEENWSQDLGFYGDFNNFTWNSEAFTLLALARACKLTNDDEYCNRATELRDGINFAWFGDGEKGAYLGHGNIDRIALSDTLIHFWAELNLFEANPEQLTHLERATKIMNFMTDDLYSDGFFSHHWIEETGRSHSFCTGCNLGALYLIYLYNEVRQKYTSIDLDGDEYEVGEGDCNDNNANINPEAQEICDEIDNNCNESVDEGFDVDGDGYRTCGGDCNDQDPAINPAAEEVCDSIDNNCNGSVDEGFIEDLDGDGYTACAGDCNDQDAAINPGVTEVCDEIDNNCDGSVDEGFDVDGDGYKICENDCDDTNAEINPGETEVCDEVDNDCDGYTDEGFDDDGDGYTECLGDCDDTDADVNEGAEEVCDFIDNDCDDLVDEGEDVDADGFDIVCDEDCDDTDETSYPGATEICDGADNDCDGSRDEDFLDLGEACEEGAGECLAEGVKVCLTDGTGTECNAEPGTPGTEECDGLDNNCDGIVPIDEIDDDGDGVKTCEGDCNDADAAINPSAAEICDDIDNDCDGDDDEDFDLGETCEKGVGECLVEGVTVCKTDGTGIKCNAVAGTPGPEMCDGLDNDCDGDDDEDFDLGEACEEGVGECVAEGVTVCKTDGIGTKCNAEPGTSGTEVCDGLDNDCDGSKDEGFNEDGDEYTTCGGDCDDTDSAVNPEATEVCDFIDNDCDESIDEGFNQDEDGYKTCEGDCNDGNALINPGADEICDSIDNDCDEDIDEGFDEDEDGYTVCGGDCNDADKKINLDQKEIAYNSKDDDCNTNTVDDDLDQDGFNLADDCNDENASINTNATELCEDNIDNNCDGNVDENCPEKSQVTCIDNDKDNYGENCEKGEDCNDNDENINLGVKEICDNEIDDNCDALVDCDDPSCKAEDVCINEPSQAEREILVDQEEVPAAGGGCGFIRTKPDSVFIVFLLNILSIFLLFYRRIYK